MATDLLDGSLAVINPDSPGSSYVISIAAPASPYENCTVGPVYVAPTVNSGALVATGGSAPSSCGPGGPLYQVNLSARTAAPLPWVQACIGASSNSS